MDKNIVWGGIALVIILALGGFMLSSKDAAAPMTSTQSSVSPVTQTSAAPTPKELTSLRDLLASNTAQKCIFSDGPTNGITYVNGGKVRSDFTTILDGEQESGHIVVRDDASYFWMDNATTGFKTEIKAANATNQQTQVAGSSSLQQTDVDKKGNYTCGVWVADESVFVLPTNVTFNDLNKLLQTMPKP